MMALYDSALVQFQITARILSERSLVFQFSDLLFSGSCKCDKKKALYFEQEGSSLCINGGAKVQVTGHRSGYRSQATGQVTGQITGHTQKQ